MIPETDMRGCESGGLTTLTGGDTFHSMNMAELKKRLSGGFRPFAIRTTDGQEFDIPHPEFMLVGKYSIAIRDKQGLINTLDPLHIVSTRELFRRNAAIDAGYGAHPALAQGCRARSTPKLNSQTIHEN